MKIVGGYITILELQDKIRPPTIRNGKEYHYIATTILNLLSKSGAYVPELDAFHIDYLSLMWHIVMSEKHDRR